MTDLQRVIRGFSRLRCREELFCPFLLSPQFQYSTFIKGRSPYLRVKVGNGGCFDVFLSQHLHFDRRVGVVEGEVVQEVGEVGGGTVHHRQGVGRRPSGLLSKGQLQELPSETFHLCRAETGQLVGVGVQDRAAAVGLPLLVHEASQPGARLEAGAADGMVLVGEKRAVFQFAGGKVGMEMMALLAFRLHGGRRREISSEAATDGLDSFVVDASNVPGAALIPTMLLLFLFLLQEVFLQRERFVALVVGQRLCGDVGRVQPRGKNQVYIFHTWTTVLGNQTKGKHVLSTLHTNKIT